MLPRCHILVKISMMGLKDPTKQNFQFILYFNDTLIGFDCEPTATGHFQILNPILDFKYQLMI